MSAKLSTAANGIYEVPKPCEARRDALDDEAFVRGLLEVYRTAFGAPPYNETEESVQRFREGIAKHAGREGFRLVVAQGVGTVLGFAYGYTSRPGQWWHDTVTRAIAPAVVGRWFTNAFEFVELAVHAEGQGQGLGGALHDALLQNLPHETAVMTTLQAETAARALCRKRGWRTLRRDVVFGEPGQHYVVLGREL